VLYNSYIILLNGKLTNIYVIVTLCFLGSFFDVNLCGRCYIGTGKGSVRKTFPKYYQPPTTLLL